MAESIDSKSLTTLANGTLASSTVVTANDQNKKITPSQKKKKINFMYPIQWVRIALATKNVNDERRLLRRDELMKQDMERFLMEIEEKHTWQAYELRERNYTRLVKQNRVDLIKKKADKNFKEEQDTLEKETGLSFFRGDIQSYKRYQDSPAKHYDLYGHSGPVHSVKISTCLKYIVSCSADKTGKLWSLKSGKCLYTFVGHLKSVNDISVHPNFDIDGFQVGIVTCSSDATLRYWNCKLSVALKVLKGHLEAVYKCSFIKDGSVIVSCSEDQTIRTWSVPNGYEIYVYRGHLSPVSTVNFSPSGRYILSGSDYGERRLMVWDTQMPRFNAYNQFPHMIYWSPEGLVKKILIQKNIPDKAFWLSANQMGLLSEGETITVWPGETAETNDIDSESDEEKQDEEEQAEDEVEQIGVDDVRELDGATVMVISVDKMNEQSLATEYIAGGSTLTISIQSALTPVAEAFVSVTTKMDQYDTYSANSGRRVGTFKAADPIPWREQIVDPLNLRPAYRRVPPGLADTCNGTAFKYKEVIKVDKATNEEIPNREGIEMLWTTPEPELGPVTVHVNFRFRNDKIWKKMTYSMKESPIRLATGNDNVSDESNERFLFDQEEKHVTFWRFVREKNWQAVESLIEKKSMLFFESRSYIRRRRIIAMLSRLFANVREVDPRQIPKEIKNSNFYLVPEPSLILTTPFIFKAGITRSSIIAEDLDPASGIKRLGSDVTTASEMMKPSEDKKVSKVDMISINDKPMLNTALSKSMVDVQITSQTNDVIPFDNDQSNKDFGKRDSSLVNDDMSAITIGSSQIIVDNKSNVVASDSVVTKGSLSIENESKNLVVTNCATEEEKEEQKEEIASDGAGLKGIKEEVEEGEEQEQESGDSSSSSDVAESSSEESESDESSSSSEEEENTKVSANTNKKRIDENASLEEKSSSSESSSDSSSDTPRTGNLFKRLFSRKKKRSNKSSTLSLFRRLFAKTEPPAVKKQSRLYRGTDRQKARPLQLPKVIFTGPIDGQKFQNEVNTLVQIDVGLISILDKMDIENVDQMRSYTSKGYSLEKMKRIEGKPVPVWLPAAVQKQKDKMRHNEDNHSPVVALDVPLVRDGMFGPIAEGLSMKLPKAYPTNAGAARTALQVAVKNHEKQLKKIQKEKILTPHEMLALMEAKEKEKNDVIRLPDFVYERQRQQELSRDIEPDVSAHVLVNSMCNGDRRKTYLTLPAIENHYPHPNITDVARLPQDYIPVVTEHDKMITTKDKKEKSGTTVVAVDYVGRKGVSKLKASIADVPIVVGGKDTSGRVGDENSTIVSELDHISSSEGLVKPSQLPIATYAKEVKKSLFFEPKFPPEVYMDRRGSFYEAPGLEDFSTEYKESKSIVGKKAIGLKYHASGQNTRKKPASVGLVCVLHTNGFDIAHQGTINTAIFSPSETRIASGGSDKVIKMWDSSDGTFVRSLIAHASEVTELCYTQDELYLVSSSADLSIMIWDLTLNVVTKKLLGHSDVINGLSISHDCSFVVSCGYDNIIKTWFLTPRCPDPPAAPKIISKSNHSVMISWKAPPSFNEPLTAFHLQHRIPGQKHWMPLNPINIPPTYRMKVVEDLSPATTYQFRLMAENRMGQSEWGTMSKQITTEQGLPAQIGRLEACDITGYSIVFYFLAENPAIYGAAPDIFKIDWSGEGKDFCDNPITLTLQDGVDRGMELMAEFKYWCSEEGQEKKRRNKKSAIANIDIPLPTMQQIIATVEQPEKLFCCVEVPNLLPGCTYRMRVAGVNKTGQGPWSEASFSQATMPGIPEKPKPPTLIANNLTWITFQWVPPNDSGSAITGYRIFIKHLNYYVDLPRWQNSYTCDRLIPGERYYMKVIAKNSVGWSEYSEYNNYDNAETATCEPDIPDNAKPVDADWGSITYEATLPYSNGRPILEFYLQYRVVESFSRGPWSKNEIYNMSNRDHVKYIEDSVTRGSSGHDGLMKQTSRQKIVRLASGILEETKIVRNTTIEKPLGKKIQFKTRDFVADTYYEIRICYKNESGLSEFSLPSHRAKTRKSMVPDKCKVLRCIDVMPTHILVGFETPVNGGNSITAYIIQIEDIDLAKVDAARVLPYTNEHKIEHLRPGGKYRLCIRADNKVGQGEYSNWTKTVTLPKGYEFVGKK